METQERLNELETERLNVEARLSASDRQALDYVKSLPGFREAYPESADEFDAAKTEEAGVQESLADWEFHIGEWVNAGDTIVHDGVRYTVIQGHRLQADWIPGEVPALYRREGETPSGGEESGGEESGNDWPDFVQPTGAHDAYAAGDQVTFEGQHYTSLIDNNVWSPAAYPTGWRLDS